MADQAISVFAKDSSASGSFCQRVIERLHAVSLIGGGELVDGGEFSEGDNSRFYLAQGFDSLGVRKGQLPKLLPEDPAISPACPRCGSDLHERWYEMVGEACEVGANQDWSLLRINCSKCGWEGRLHEVRDAAGVGAFLRHEFVFFSHVNVTADEFRRFEGSLRGLLGEDVLVKLYGFT